MSVSTYRLILVGLGNVGQSVLNLLHSQRALLRDYYKVAFTIVGAVELGGAAIDPAGLDVEALLVAGRAGRNVATLPGVGRPGMSGLEVARTVEADLLLEATPVNLQHGQPGLDIVRAALDRRLHVVLANKGPLVLAYDELATMSDLAGDRETRRQGDKETRRQGAKKIGDGSSPLLLVSRSPCLRFSACVGGALPTINLGRRDLAGSRIARVEGVFNGTTQSILRAMESGIDYAEALADAQRRGIAETNPALDVEGWDAANKLVILSNAVLDRPTSLSDVTVEGITHLSAHDLCASMARGERIVLLCLAERVNGDYRLSVRPTALPLDHPLARMSGDEMGVVYYTDFEGCISATSIERGAEPAAVGMLRDVLEIVRQRCVRCATMIV